MPRLVVVKILKLVRVVRQNVCSFHFKTLKRFFQESIFHLEIVFFRSLCMYLQCLDIINPDGLNSGNKYV